MIEINNTRYYSIDEFPNFAELNGKPINVSLRKSLVNELEKSTTGTIYADGIIDAIITPPKQSVYAQLEKQICISGMISIIPKSNSSDNFEHIEILVQNGLVNGRPSNHKERILITNVWKFYCILQNRNLSFWRGTHCSSTKESIIERIKSVSYFENTLPDLDKFYDSDSVTKYCKSKGLSIDLNKIHLHEQIVSERAKDITNKWMGKPARTKNATDQLSAIESSFVLCLERFLKSNTRGYDSTFIQTGVTIIHLVDNSDFEDNDDYAIAIRDIALKIKSWVSEEQLTLYDAKNHLPIGIDELTTTFNNTTVTKLDGFNILLNHLISIDQLIELLVIEKFEQSRVKFFVDLKNKIFPDPINLFKTQVINLLSDPSKIYEKINFPIPIVALSLKQYFEAHPLIEEFPPFKEFYFWLESNYEKNPQIKKVNPREVIFDDGDERTKSHIGRNFKSLVEKIKPKLNL